MILKYIKSVCWNILKFAVSIFLSISIPLGAVVFTPIYLFRFVLSKVAKYVRPDLGKILTTISTLGSFHRYDKPNPPGVAGTLKIIQGIVGVQELRDAFTLRVLPAKLPNGELQYVELTQYPVTWMGFLFWKNEPDFRIENHVIEYEQSSDSGEAVLKRMTQDALSKPMKAGQSPWEMIVATNYKLEGSSEPYTFVLSRAHHSIGDGLALQKLIVEGVYGQEFPKEVPQAANLIKKARGPWFYISFPFRAIWEFAEMLMAAYLERSPLHVPARRRTNSSVAFTSKIPLEHLKKIKNAKGVSLSSVTMSACTGSLKTMMERKGMRIPEELACWLPIPLPGRKDKLRNHLAPVTINLPLKASNPDKRLRKLNKSYLNLVNSTGPVFNNIMGICTGGLFVPLAKALGSSIIPSILISNFPCNFSHLEFEGRKQVDQIGYAGLCDLESIAFFPTTFNGSLRVTVVAENILMSQEETEELVNLIEQELWNNGNECLA